MEEESVMLRKCSVVCAVLALGALALSTASANPITVGFVQQNSVIPAPGGTVNVDIVANIPQEWAVVGWGIDLSIATPGIAALTGQTIGSSWDAVSYTPDGDLLAGLAPTPPGVGIWGSNVILATLTFTGLAEGVTQIGLSDDSATDLTEGFVYFPVGRPFAPADYEEGSLTIFPEPASFALLALALVIRRR
jgi:hypothetical protein